MIGLVRSLISLGVLAAFLLFGFTVPPGKRTLFEHVGRIWKSNETQELVEDVKETSKPVLERVTRGVKAGVREATIDLDGGASDGESSDGDSNEGESKTNVEDHKDETKKLNEDSRLDTLRNKAQAKAQAAAQREVEIAAKKRAKREADRLTGGK